jgi:hypothetical protein
MKSSPRRAQRARREEEKKGIRQREEGGLDRMNRIDRIKVGPIQPLILSILLILSNSLLRILFFPLRALRGESSAMNQRFGSS